MAGRQPDDIGTGETVSTGGIAKGPRDGADLAPGQMVGEYRIEGLLGEGGMGRVYSATHPVIAKRAAIKILHPELSINREAVERFANEARAVNQIGHPNIVDIFSFGNLPDGRCYFVMEWLRGQSLRDRLRASPLPIADSLSVIETIAIALEAAHEKGIVHRDLKPDNIYLVEVKGTAPTVKLLDFGIAKLLGNDSDRVEKTRTGNLLGTPAYISPEQARGQHVDHRTDIYALGALLYELLTGSLVFPAESAADMIAKHLYENPPDARHRNPSVPAEIAGLMIAMLAKDANRRPTLEQVRTTLRPLRAGHYAPPPGGGYAPMYTPQQPPMATPAPSYGTPPPPYQTNVPAQPTPAPPMHSVVPTSMGLHTGMAPRKSRLPIILVAVLLAGGLGAAAFVAVGSRSGEQKATPPPVEPAVTIEPTEKAQPETPTKPVEPAAITPTDASPAPEAAATQPADATATQPADAKTGAKPATKKTGKKRTGPKRTGPVEDPDAPM